MPQLETYTKEQIDNAIKLVGASLLPAILKLEQYANNAIFADSVTCMEKSERCGQAALAWMRGTQDITDALNVRILLIAKVRHFLGLAVNNFALDLRTRAHLQQTVNEDECVKFFFWYALYLSLNYELADPNMSNHRDNLQNVILSLQAVLTPKRIAAILNIALIQAASILNYEYFKLDYWFWIHTCLMENLQALRRDYINNSTAIEAKNAYASALEELIAINKQRLIDADQKDHPLIELLHTLEITLPEQYQELATANTAGMYYISNRLRACFGKVDDVEIVTPSTNGLRHRSNAIRM